MKQIKRHYLNIIAKDGASWSGKWRKCKKEYYKTHVKICMCCNYEKKTELHHIKPRHIYPELALLHTNLIVLCRDCHFHLGHRNNFRDYNPQIKDITDFIWKT